MRAGTTLTVFFALFVATTAGIAVYAAVERDYRLPIGPPLPVSAFSGRCYSLTFPADLHRTVDPELPLPSYVRLTRAAATAAPLAGWFRAQRSVEGRSKRSASQTWGQPLWRPAGSDSIDVRYLGWPLGLRLRLFAHTDTARGRVLVNGDVGGEWDRLATVSARVVPCATVAFDTSRAQF